MTARPVVLALLVVLLVLLVAAPTATASTWIIDPVHSSVAFRIRHMDVSWVIGRFNAFSGTIVFDPATPGAGSVTMSVRAASVDTANAKRDAHLRTADFFDAEQFPDITFASTGWKRIGDDLFEVTGDLTLHGTTRTVTARLEFGGTGAGRDGKRLAGFQANFAVKRSEFGMDRMLGPIGNAVQLTVSVEATEQIGPDTASPPASNRMAPDRAPTPYRAEEIRRGCPPGRATTFRVETPGQAAVLETIRFGKGDEEGVELAVSRQSLEGKSLGATQTSRTTWKALRSHASYPAITTKITTEAIETPAGKFDCWLYTVRSKKDGHAIVSRYWFAKKRPGPPVRAAQETDGKSIMTMSLVKDVTR